MEEKSPGATTRSAPAEIEPGLPGILSVSSGSDSLEAILSRVPQEAKPEDPLKGFDELSMKRFQEFLLGELQGHICEIVLSTPRTERSGWKVAELFTAPKTVAATYYGYEEPMKLEVKIGGRSLRVWVINDKSVPGAGAIGDDDWKFWFNKVDLFGFASAPASMADAIYQAKRLNLNWVVTRVRVDKNDLELLGWPLNGVIVLTH